jgi:multicomponent Na+:H+ antiporter subunit F
MTDFLIVAAGFILFTVAVGLVRVLSGPGNSDRLMAAQLLGTGGVATLVIVSSATGAGGIGDVALSLSLLAAFASVAFVTSAAPPETADLPEPADDR